ncbi:hypothetical protein NDU88_000373 [Pleurodeles waltl]|uniref:Reverse transcriptase domain-containing protein n=1 Tax=Pleurodeles waltl TaxID=8319 RepID=A0AAV7V4X3_PLEWA|nr:hypothetical protein NDU88_000373 [Pleurodeles waltl]
MSNFSALKTAMRKHHQLIRTTKRSFYKERIDNNTHNSKELFTIIKELTNPKSCTIDPPHSQDLCNSLSNYFHRKIADIRHSFTTPSSSTTTTATTNTTAPYRTNRLNIWNPTNDKEIVKTKNSIHSGSLTDPCPHHIFNKASQIIAPQLRAVINSSFDTATFPDFWKHAEVNALLKKPKADPEDLTKYRPISLLPFPAKVTEKIVNAQLSHFLEENNILNTSQSGFRKNHSTETALIACTDDIRTRVYKGETIALILLDLSAAFDTVCHQTLHARLFNAGIHHKALDWLTSFLSERTQRVCLPHFRSTATKIICGLPQGSSLSPTLFNIYMAPFANILRPHGITIISYADDTQLIIYLTKNPATAKINLHARLLDTANWMTTSHFKLNSNKTEIIIFGPNKTAWNDSWCCNLIAIRLSISRRHLVFSNYFEHLAESILYSWQPFSLPCARHVLCPTFLLTTLENLSSDKLYLASPTFAHAQ